MRLRKNAQYENMKTMQKCKSEIMQNIQDMQNVQLKKDNMHKLKNMQIKEEVRQILFST